MSRAATSTATNTATPAAVAAAGSVSGRPDAAITPLATAPSTAAPTALPSERANMLVPVATPRSAQPTLACAAINEGVATRPMPIPVTKQVIATAATDGVRARSAKPGGARPRRGRAR